MNLSALLPKVHFVHSVLAHQTERGIRWQRRASAYLPNVSQNAARKTARPGARARNPRLPGAIAHLSKESRTPAGLGAIGEHSDCGSRTPRVGCGGGHSLPAPADPHSGAGRRDILKRMEEAGLILPLPPPDAVDPYDIDPVAAWYEWVGYAQAYGDELL
jgi:hypothetical protein